MSMSSLHFSTPVTCLLALVAVMAVLHYAVDAIRSKSPLRRLWNELVAAVAFVWLVVFLTVLVQAAVTVTK